MKTFLFLSGLLVQGVLGNLLVPMAETQCSNHCLSGMECDNNKNICKPKDKAPGNYLFRRVAHPAPIPAPGDFSVNGLCGPNNGGTICNPASTVYTGGCCSQYGYCGNSAAHCGTGCVSGCTTATTPPVTPPVTSPVGTPRADGRCGTGFAGATCAGSTFGTCCSSYGYCGSTSAYCLAANGCQSGCTGTPTSPVTPPATSLATAPRTDGRCGTGFAGATCAGSAFGTCCSSYGYCGSTDGHCLAANGCQSGCTGTQTSAPPTISSAPAAPSRTDGRCGTSFAGATCAGSAFGTCCSSYGYCGSTDGHCLAANGCQSGCTGTPVTSVTPPTSSTTAEPVLGSPTPSTVPVEGPSTDGTCGHSNTPAFSCAGWSLGECCSAYGFCGNTDAHCGDGCQADSSVGADGTQKCKGGGSTPAPGPSPAPITNGGAFAIIGQSGVPAMHAGLLPNGRVVFLDKVENYTQLRLPNGQYAYSSEYDPVTNTVVPLAYLTNAFCAGGIFLANGDFVSLGGNAPLDFIDTTIGDGFDAIRYLTRSSSDASLNGQAWREPGNKMNTKRWYASAQIMADGTIFVASGSLNGLDPTVPANNNPTYEILSPTGITQGNSIPLDILVKNQPYYMYPFMHLLKSGEIFIFVAKSSDIFNVGTNTISKVMPDLPGTYRTYPNTGGSVLLPLSSATQWNSKIMVCGGGSYQDITSPTEPSCGVIAPEAATPAWEMDAMPQGRGMVEGVLLPDGTVLWLNGCNKGAQGFELATDPTLAALLYDPTKALGQRWTQLASSTIPRLYHSVAVLLLDGTVLITGSNPHEMPILTASPANPFITDFRVERFTPPYLQGANVALRPTAMVLSSKSLPANGSTFTIKFNVPVTAAAVKVSLYYGGFVTHSVHMGHRMLFLDNTGFKAGTTAQTITVTMPPNKNTCPPGPYVVYVVADGIPSVGQFVQVI